MHKIKQMKAELKALAEEIRATRKSYKDKQRRISSYDLAHPDWKKDWRSQIYKDRCKVTWDGVYFNYQYPANQYRYLHVAYCLLRGTPYELIEPKVLEGNEIDVAKVEKLMEAYREEAVLPDAG